MEFLHCTMPEFAVLGKEGSTHSSNSEWIKQLWTEANSHFNEITELALRDDQGNLAGFWGAMTSLDRTFQPWENHLSVGLYLAGVQIPVETEAPKGWVKWIVPAFDYLYGQVDGDPQTAVQLGLEEIKRQGLAEQSRNIIVPRKMVRCIYFFQLNRTATKSCVSAFGER